MRGTPVVQTLLVSTARTESGTSSVHNVSRAEEVALDFDVTAISGTGARIGFALQWRDDPESGAFFTSKKIVRTASTGRIMVRAKTLASYFRLSYEIFGTTPSVTFSARIAWRE